MTDVTSPIAKLSARLPKGNGFSRAVPDLYERRGDIVWFCGAMRIEETSIDANDVEKVLASIQRFEIAEGPAVADLKDLVTICSQAATSVKGQQSLFVEDRKADASERAGLVRDLLEWGQEQEPPLDVQGVTDRWNSFHGGHYDARIDSPKTPVRYLREFALVVGAIAEDPFTPSKDATAEEPAETAELTTDGDASIKGPEFSDGGES